MHCREHSEAVLSERRVNERKKVDVMGMDVYNVRDLRLMGVYVRLCVSQVCTYIYTHALLDVRARANVSGFDY